MKLNTPAAGAAPIYTHEGGRATPTDNLNELKRSVLTCMLWEPSFYETGDEVAQRIAALVPLVKPFDVAALARDARDNMNLRHVPLFLLAELSKIKCMGSAVEYALAHVIQRADELSEFLAIYWREKRHPLSAGVKRGLARAFPKFNAYELGKYNADSKIKLRDVMFLVSPHPQDDEQAEVWKKLASCTLESPDTWEVELSKGKDKKATFERLMREGHLGGMALLKNLRGMLAAGVDETLIRERLAQGAARAFPYRFVVAAKHAPSLEDAIEVAMFKAIEKMEELPGKTGLLIDVSGSMDEKLGATRPGAKQETSRIDVAAGLAILVREKCQRVNICTFSENLCPLPPRRGFALRDAIEQSQPHGSTQLKGCLEMLRVPWMSMDRVIVITDEQSHDGIATPWAPKSYVINVAPNKNGVSYRNGWRHIDGWSERVIDYIRETEFMQLPVPSQVEHAPAD